MNIKICSVSPEQAPLALLLEADPSEINVKKYLENSICYVAELSGKVVGVCVLNSLKDKKIELYNIAVDPGLQAKGIGTTLLNHVIEMSKQLGVKRIELGTGTFGYQLAFYQRAGFRVDSIEKDFFILHYEEPIFEHGIQHKDRLRLFLDL